MKRKNSLTEFKKATSPILPDSAPATSDTSGEPPKKRGRNKKPPAEKRSYRVLVSFTEAEAETLKSKAGLVKEATYIYSFLKEHGFFEK